MTATLHVLFGPSGAGKTTYLREFVRREGAVPFVLDDWMGRLFGPDLPEPVEYDWVVERVGRCEAQIWSTAAAVIAAGTSVMLDIGLLRKADRDRVREIAAAVELPLQFHFVDAPAEVRRQRVAARNTVRGETFAIEVTPEMFEFMEGIYEAPDAEELAGAIVSRAG